MACLSLVLFGFWAVLLLSVTDAFQNAAGTDSLAMIDVLFPYFWVILLSFVGLCFFAFVGAESNRWLHMLLLGQLSLMLYFTPFLLSGFSWSPDSLWHAGAANYLPEVLSGSLSSRAVLTQYVQAYPLSYMITYFAKNVLGISLIDYTLYVYPLIFIIAFSILAYIFAARIFNPKVAFLSMLFTLPALHYIEPHVSPFSAGTVIVLFSLILLTFKSKLAVGLSFLSIVALTVIHPISPIALGVYILAAILVGFVFRKKPIPNLAVSNTLLIPLFIFLCVVWFAWTTMYAMQNYLGVETALLNAFNLGFLRRLFSVSEFTVGGDAFIYPQIHQLGLAIYGFFLLISLPLVIDLRRVLFGHEKAKTSVLIYRRMTLFLAAILYGVMGLLLFLSSGERFLLGRGLLFFVFMGSIASATYFTSPVRIGNKVKNILALGIIIILVCTFPVVSYSKEAYNTFTPSAGAGLSFLAAKANLSGRSLSMGGSQQLASYVNLSEGLDLLKFPPDMTLTPDLIVFRVNTYFLISMRSDMSFTDNSYTKLRNVLDNNLENDTLYNKLYSNSRFDIYARPP
jgi:hypothetical protein